MSFSLALGVALLGALGSLARWGAQQGIQRAVAAQFPAGTMFVNLVGSFLIGAVMATFAARGTLDSRTRIALTTGFLGGFTTYSAFAYDTLSLIEKRDLAAASIYVAATVVGCLAACWAGSALVPR